MATVAYHGLRARWREAGEAKLDLRFPTLSTEVIQESLVSARGAATAVIALPARAHKARWRMRGSTVIGAPFLDVRESASTGTRAAQLGMLADVRSESLSVGEHRRCAVTRVGGTICSVATLAKELEGRPSPPRTIPLFVFVPARTHRGECVLPPSRPRLKRSRGETL